MGRAKLIGGGIVEISPEEVVRIYRKHPEHPVTLVVTDTQTHLVDEEARVMWARLGGGDVLTDYDDPTSRTTCYLAMRKIVALTKKHEDSSREEDPTLVHLSNGDTVQALESIRTLSARLRGWAERGTVDLDIPGTKRPACLVADHVLEVAGDTVSLVLLAGGHVLRDRTPARGLREKVDEARSKPPAEEPAP